MPTRPRLEKSGSPGPIRRTVQVAATLLIAALSGWLAAQIGLPLPWILGPLVVVTALAVGGVSLAGSGVYVPMWLRNVMVPVIGVMLGASFSPDVVAQMGGWWSTLLGLLVFIGVSTWLVYILYRRVFAFTPATAYFAAVPGGLLEMTLIGEALGGDGPRISLIHFCRIVLAVLILPFILRMIMGPVGEVVIPSGTEHGGLDAIDVVILIASGILGYLGARAIRMPGDVIAGPMLASAAVHATGLTSAAPPAILIIVSQVVIGAALGSGFASLSFADLRQALRAAVAASVVMLAVTAAVSLGMSLIVDQPLVALVLAYAAGGVAEMSLIALAIGIGIPFVAAHHVARIVLSVLLMPTLWRRVLAPRLQPGQTGKEDG